MPPNSSRIAKLESGHAVLHEQMTVNTDLLKSVSADVKQIGTDVTVLGTKMAALQTQKRNWSAWAMTLVAALVGLLGGVIVR